MDDVLRELARLQRDLVFAYRRALLLLCGKIMRTVAGDGDAEPCLILVAAGKEAGRDNAGAEVRAEAIDGVVADAGLQEERDAFAVVGRTLKQQMIPIA